LVGIGGWTYEPWRQTFYPREVPQKRELAYAASKLTAIEINSTFHRQQSRETFQRWHDETPASFVFTVKASMMATNRKDLAAVGPAIAQFLDSGLEALGDKLGPILWQLAPTKRFVRDELDAFLSLLPRERFGRALEHVIEPRHASFRTTEYVALCRAHGVASVFTDSLEYPVFADRTAPFSYLRLVRSDAAVHTGYRPAQLDRIAQAARALAAGGSWELPTLDAPTTVTPGPAYVFFINGAKERAPAAALALLGRLD